MRLGLIHKFSLFALLAVASFIAASPALAKITVVEKTEFYLVRGKNGEEIVKAMATARKAGISNSKQLAGTSVKYDIGKYEHVIKNGRCTIKELEIIITVRLIAPQWQGNALASMGTRAAWDAFMAELLILHRNHVLIARQGAKELETELKKLSGPASEACRGIAGPYTGHFESLAREWNRRHAANVARQNQKNSKITKLQIALLKSK